MSWFSDTLSAAGDPLNLFGNSGGSALNNMMDPANLLKSRGMPTLQDPSGGDPTIVVNPWLDNLGMYNSQRIGRSSLVIDRQRPDVTVSPIGGPPARPPIDPGKFLDPIRPPWRPFPGRPGNPGLPPLLP